MALTADVTVAPASGASLSGTVHIEIVATGTDNILNAEVLIHTAGVYTPKYAVFTCAADGRSAFVDWNTTLWANSTQTYRIAIFNQPPFSPNPTIEGTAQRGGSNAFTWTIQNGAGGGGRGPLVRSGTNPRYFVHANVPGTAVWMGGFHGFLNLQDAGHYPDASTRHTIDFTAHLSYVTARGLNFVRLWHTAVAPTEPSNSLKVATPAVYQRSGTGGHADGGNKFDLTLLNQAYFDRLYNRCLEAQNAGVYVNVMLFDHFSVESDPDYATNTHNFTYWNPNNNINGINANYSGNGFDCDVFKTTQSAALRTAIELYVQKLVDTLCDGVLTNIIWDPGNELDSSTIDWQYQIIDFLQTRQALKSIQFPIGITGGPGNDSAIAAINNAPPIVVWSSRGSEGFRPYDDMPNNTYGKVDISDSDHFGRSKLWDTDPESDLRLQWPFICLTRGYCVMHYDDILVDELSWGPPSQHERILLSIGQARRYADRCFNLLGMTPQPSLATGGFCLASVGGEYLVLRKATSGSITFSGLPAGTYKREWLNIVNDTAFVQTDLVHPGGDAGIAQPGDFGTSMALIYLRNANLGGTPVAGAFLSQQSDLVTRDLSVDAYQVYMERTSGTPQGFKVNYIRFKGDTSAKDFGARGDGTGDDGPALQKLLNWSLANGAVGRLNDGHSFRTTQGVSAFITSNRDSPFGFSGNAEIVSAINNSNTSVIFIQSNAFCERLHLCDFSIRGARFNGGTERAGIRLYAPNDLDNGSSLHQFAIRNVRVYHCGGDGFLFEGDVFEGYVHGCSARTCARSGIVFDNRDGNCTSIDVVSPNIAKCDEYGIRTMVSTPTVRGAPYDIFIWGGHIIESGYNGIRLENGMDSPIQSMSMENNCHRGPVIANNDAHIYADRRVNVIGSNVGSFVSQYDRFHVRAHIQESCFMEACEMAVSQVADPAVLALSATGNGFMRLSGCKGNIRRVGGNAGTYNAYNCTNGTAHDGTTLSATAVTGNK